MSSRPMMASLAHSDSVGTETESTGSTSAKPNVSQEPPS